MSNEQIYGGPLRAEVTKTPGSVSVDVEGAGMSHTARSNSLVKSIGMALNEFYSPEVTLEEQYENVNEELFSRHGVLVEKETELENIIQSYEDHLWLPDYYSDTYRDILEVVRDYIEDLETTMEVLDKEQNYAFGNEQDSD